MHDIDCYVLVCLPVLMVPNSERRESVSVSGAVTRTSSAKAFLHGVVIFSKVNQLLSLALQATLQFLQLFLKLEALILPMLLLPLLRSCDHAYVLLPRCQPL